MSDIDSFEKQVLTALATAPAKRTVDDEIALHHTLDEIRRLRAERAEHDRRAALVATWAEGFSDSGPDGKYRPPKRYTVTVNGKTWTATYRIGGTMWRYYLECGEELLRTTNLDVMTAAMLAVSENWQEVEA